MPREQPETSNVLEKLFACDSDLKNEIFIHIASVIRTGNFSASECLLKQLLSSPNLNPLSFSQDHYDLLIGNIPQLNHLKKYNLIQHNVGPNFCSPIHSAAISDNS